MYKVIKVYRSGVVKLPASIRQEAGIEVGDELLVTVKEGKIVLIPRKFFDPIEAYSSELGEDVEEEVLFEEGVKAFRRLLNSRVS